MKKETKAGRQTQKATSKLGRREASTFAPPHPTASSHRKHAAHRRHSRRVGMVFYFLPYHSFTPYYLGYMSISLFTAFY